MLSALKKALLARRQSRIARRFPGVGVVLHPEMPTPSLSKMEALAATVYAVNACEERIAALSDEALRAKTEEFRRRIEERHAQMAGELAGIEEALREAAIPEEKERLRTRLRRSRNSVFAEVLPEAFAAVREAAKRTIGLRHFDVQIAGGVVLHEGNIAEMSTGEGKTLVATLPAYLNALLGRGVHIVTVNDYLARRDREWMGPVFEFLGLRVGVIQHEMSDEERQRNYACDVTYGTNNEFGFDYLRDNMKYRLQDLVQRPFYFAIVDEVDSILIDEARTPLIISGPAEEATDKYYTAQRIATQLKGRRVTDNDEVDAKYKGIDLAKGFDYLADEKGNTISLTDEGEAKACRLWGVENLHTMETREMRHHTIQALRAKEFFQRDVDYVVKEGEVIIVDEFTGRLMPGRRWSDGLHQAVEAKEGMKIERENQTLATVTFQNYFRMYEKLSGMTGTAYTEANEFKSIYQLDVVVMPTNRPLIRKNHSDCVHKTQQEKFKAVVEEIVSCHGRGQPVLVGTISIEKSELLSEMLKRRGIPHQVLNAKYHEMEAQIVAQAGRHKGVTIATNMAGRGTDILLGGNPDFMARTVVRQQEGLGPQEQQAQYRQLLEKYRLQTGKEHEAVVAAGGLHVVGTERHEARRIDNQLRGRSGRQGDPGSSRFFVSLQDDLMRLFGSDRLMGLMEKLGLEEGQVIEHPWVTKSIEIAQKRVEAHNFEIRKQLLEYDNVMNKQREVIYAQRRSTLEGVSLKEELRGMLERIVERIVAAHAVHNLPPAEWNLSALAGEVHAKFGAALAMERLGGAEAAALKEMLCDELLRYYEEKERVVGAELTREMERMVFLQVIDSRWKDHLYAMDSLREGIGLRAYGQRDPLIEYKREAFEMFSEMIGGIEDEAVEMLFKLRPAVPERFRGVFSQVHQELVHPDAGQFRHPAPEAAAPEASAVAGVSAKVPAAEPASRAGSEKVGRNDPCPCGSGKKYKKCCGR